MFIPVSLVSGQTHVDCEIDVSGELLADCWVDYEGSNYAPNTSILVERTKTIRLHANVTQYAEISVVLAAKQHYWYVDVPKALRYIEADEYKLLAGTTYGTLLNTNTQAQTSYVETGTFTAEDAIASIDFIKKEVWFFNTLSEVKKLTLTTAPVAVLFVPRWSAVGGVSTVCYVATESQLHKLDATFNVAETFAIEPGVVAASGDVDGFVVLAYSNRIVLWRDSEIVTTIADAVLTDIHSLYVTPANNYVVGCSQGIATCEKIDGTWFSSLITARTGRYWSFDINDEYLYAADAANRLLVRITMADYSYNVVYFDKIPRDVVVNGDDVYVSFLNDSVSKKFSRDLSTSTDVTGLASYGAAYLNDYMVTDLYADAVDVTTAEPVAELALIRIENLARGTEFVHPWIVDWPRPLFVRVGTQDVVVRVNGDVFTSGYLRQGDSVTFMLPSTQNWYNDRTVALVGLRPMEFVFRTVPKLFPTLEIIPSVLSAFLRVTYDDLFEVEGMTYGFSVNVRTDSPTVLFAVNEGAYGTTGTIQNGDIVSVTATINSLLAQRTAHLIVTDNAEEHPVGEWTVLPMLLDGVTLGDTHTEEKSRFAERVSPSELLNHVAAPVLVDASDVFAQSTSPLLSEQSVGFTQTTQSALTPVGTSVEYTYNGALQASAPVYSTSTDVAENCHLSLEACDTTWLLSRTKAEHSTSLTGVLMHSSHEESVTGVAERQAFSTFATWAAIGESTPAPTTAYGNALWIEAHTSSIVYGNTDWTRTAHHVEAEFGDYTIRESGSTLHQDAAWSLSANYVTDAVSSVYFRVSSVAPIEASTDTLLRLLPASLFFEPVTQRREFSLPHLFAAEATFSWRYPVSEIETARMLREQDAAHVVATTTELRETFTAITFSRSFWLRATHAPYAINTAFVRQTKTAPSEVAAVFEHVGASGVVVVAMSEARFVHASGTDYALTAAQSGFFDTQLEAQAYAEDIGAAALAVYVQLNGKWIFRTSPTATSAACAIGEVPVVQQRRFGYVGGG